jgi:hypothetical protein
MGTAAGLFLLLLIEFLSGVAVNLYVTIPSSHPGSSGSSYIGRLFQGVPWAIAHGAPWLQLHALLGVLLILGGLRLLMVSTRVHGRAWVFASSVGLLGLLFAGFNGGSFVNYGHDISSMLMSVGCAAAMASYAAGVYIGARSKYPDM